MLFFDIETAAGKPTLKEVDQEIAAHWSKKIEGLEEMSMKEQDKAWMDSAGLKAEYGQIVCISVGFKASGGEYRTRSFTGTEAEILLGFSDLLNKHYSVSRHKIAGHNIKGFDIPYTIRRLVLNGLPVPKMLDIRGKKPWQMDFVFDTMEEWAYGQFRYFTSLDLLCHLFGVPSPKGKVDGSMVGTLFYQGKIDEIAEYCEGDVVSNIKVAEKMLL